jgi:hypothetical protein
VSVTTTTAWCAGCKWGTSGPGIQSEHSNCAPFKVADVE